MKYLTIVNALNCPLIIIIRIQILLSSPINFYSSGTKKLKKLKRAVVENEGHLTLQVVLLGGSRRGGGGGWVCA